MSREQEPRPYTPEEVHGLIRSGLRASQEELAKAYNDLPYQIDGIAIRVYDPQTSSEVEEDAIVAFNAELAPDELLVLRRGRDDYISISDVPSFGLVARKRVKPSGTQLAGRFGLNGAISFGGGYAMAEALDSPVVGSVGGLALFLAAQNLTRGHYENKERRRAIAFMEATERRFRDPAQGYVSLLRDKTYSFPRQAGLQPEAVAAWESLVHYATHRAANDVLSGIWPPVDDTSLGIVPSALVKGALEQNKHPRELWYSGLGELVHALSDAEKRVVTGEKGLLAAKNFHSILGKENPEEIARWTDGIEAAKLQLLVISGKLVDLSENWRKQTAEGWRIKATEWAMEAVALGEPDEAHPLEMHIQTFTTIASSALSHLDPDNRATLIAANRLHGHLSRLRKQLTSPAQIEHFYRALHKDLSESMPELPTWEAVASEFAPKSEGN